MPTSIMRWVCCSCGNRKRRWSFMRRMKREARSRGLTTCSPDSAESNGGRSDADFQSFSGSLAFRAIELPGSVAFQFRDDTSGATALFAPSVGELTEELRNAVHASDVVLFDGTFWTDGELGVVRPGAALRVR